MVEKDRAERLKLALRENLKRRKAQARGREASKDASEERSSGVEPVSKVKRQAD
jgi:hypothetical protein